MAEKAKLVISNNTDAVHKSIQSAYGDYVVIPGEAVLDESVRIVPVSPRLDLALNGGIPDGTWITSTGKAGCGKTTLALHYAAKCQRPEYGDREVYYLDIEGRLKKINLQGIPSLRMDKFHAIRSHKKKILSGQDFLKIGEDILRGVENCVLIIDSYSALCHESELVGEVGMSTRGAGGYTLLSQFCRQMCNVVPVMKSNVIGITHLMANVTSPYGGFTEKSGTSITYHADIKLKAKKFDFLEDSRKRIIGQKVTWFCEKSALGGPGGEVEGYIRYGKGIDELYELLMMAKDIGLITETTRGGWHSLDFSAGEKIQGAEVVYQTIAGDLQLKGLLEQKLKEMLIR